MTGYDSKRKMAADKLHWSDCAVHNGPAYPAGPCDCGVAQELDYKVALNEWLDKTEWVQEKINSGHLGARYLGMHRADVLRDLAYQNTVTGKAPAQPADNPYGYDWSMLEAAQESLREHMARIKELEAQLSQPSQGHVADRLERLLWEYIDLQAAHPEHKPNPKTWPHLMTYAPLPAQEPVKLWLWKNFVDGKPEYWAFDNPFPIFMDSHDPQTLGEPCGYALLKPSRAGRTDVSDEQVLQDVQKALAQPAQPVQGRTCKCVCHDGCAACKQMAQPAQPAQEPVAQWLEDAFREGWEAYRESEFASKITEDWAFGNSFANCRMIDLQQNTPPQPAQEPINLLEARKIAAEYGTPDSQIDSGNLYFALSKCLEHIDAQPAQEPMELERNFCPRCGKRTADLTVIHTCTPPQGDA